MQKSYNQYKMA